MVALVDNFVCDVSRDSFISIRKVEGIEEDTVFHAFKIVFSIICFQSILVIEFIGSHEGLELEVLIFDKLGQFFQKFRTVFLDKSSLNVIVLEKVLNLVCNRVKGFSIWYNIFFKERIQSFFILMKHDLAVYWTVDFIVKTKIRHIFKRF